MRAGLSLVVAVLVVLLALGVAGCSDPCGGHGGIRVDTGHGSFLCNDGTWA